MATHSSILAWRIPWTGDPRGLQSMRSQRVRHDWSSSTHVAFFMIHLSHLYMTTGKIIALTTQTFVSKILSLLLNMLSRFVIAFLPRSKHLLILWLQSLSPVVLEPKKVKSVIISTFSPSICHEVIRLDDAMIFVFWMMFYFFNYLF